MDSLDALIGDLFWWGGESNHSSGTLTSVIASGQLPIIQNENLRDLLAEWPRVIGDIADNERNEIWEYRNAFKPFMHDLANMPQINNRITHQPGSDVPFPMTEVPEATQRTDHWPLVKNPRFRNILLFRLWSNTDILYDFDELEPHLDETLRLLEVVVEG